MKKQWVFVLLSFHLLLLTGCGSNNDSLASKQEKAIHNSIEYISHSSFSSKDKINTKISSIRYATNSTWESVWSNDGPVEKNAIDSSDWIITLGESSNHDFAMIVCDSNTSEVIGYIPID